MALLPQALKLPAISRRTAVQAGAVGILGIGLNHLAALRATGDSGPSRARAAIYIFLSGGLSQLDSFDLKPLAPSEIRGEFRPIPTRTPGIPRTAAWYDAVNRPHYVYHGEPITGLL